MANTIDWGKATQNNTNGFGKYQNTINAGIIYADSYSGETTLVGTSAAFSYSKSSFHQDEADPTPTITGTTGGTFNADAGLVFVDTGTHNSSTGQIDLSASTIDSHIITYTVGGVQSGQTIAVTASPFVDNNFSMQFDGINGYISVTPSDNLVFGTNDFTISMWVKRLTSGVSFPYLIDFRDSEPETTLAFYYKESDGKLECYINGVAVISSSSGTKSIPLNQWTHIILIREGTNLKTFVNTELDQSVTNSSNLISTTSINIGRRFNGVQYFEGNIDEVAIWNTALGETAIQEIYNATANNTGKVLDLNTDSGNYTNSSSLQYWNRMGD